MRTPSNLIIGKAKVTAGGIRFLGRLAYTCQLAGKEKWFQKVLDQERDWDIRIAYNSENLSFIYLPDYNYEECCLVEKFVKYRC